MGDDQQPYKIVEQPNYKRDECGFVEDLQDLKRWYRWSLRKVIVRRQELEELIEAETGMTMEQLGEKSNRPAYKRFKAANDAWFAELQELSEITSDMNYVIEWLHTGRRPGGSKRGIERRAAYQREKLMDPVKMQSLVVGANAGGPSNLTDHERFRLEEALRRLSPLEREAYEMAHGQGFSHAYIARLLNVTKSSVDTMIERAQKKVTEDLENNLFLMDQDE